MLLALSSYLARKKEDVLIPLSTSTKLNNKKKLNKKNVYFLVPLIRTKK